MSLQRQKYAIVMLVVAVVSTGAIAQQKDASAKKTGDASLPSSIWRDPGDVAALDMINGAGGKAHAPTTSDTYTFVKEDLQETSPKFIVTDEHGVEWKVKLGEEPQSETAATRFLWAAGYFVDEDYFIADLRVKNLPKLERGESFVSGGIVHAARLERKLTDVKKLDNWSWFKNPFVDQRELNGLRVMMSLLNNWDLKEVNNTIYEVDGQHRYVVSDAGATFGNTGNMLTRSKSVPKDYADSKFIDHIAPGFVDFVMHSRPFFTDRATEPGNYTERTDMEKITRHIPRADAKWLGQRLAQLTDAQIRDGFRTAGYAGADLDLLAKTMRRRITQLGAL